MLSSAGKPRNKPAKDGEIIAPTLLAMAVTPAAAERPPGTTTVVYNCQSGAAIYETPERSSSAAVVSGRTVPFSCSHKLAHPTGAYSKPPASQPPPVLQPDTRAQARSAARPGHRRRNHPVPLGLGTQDPVVVGQQLAIAILNRMHLDGRHWRTRQRALAREMQEQLSSTAAMTTCG